MIEREKPKWALPSQIPLPLLRGKDLEECLYWLLDGMGALDIEWRVGGRGQGGNDGARDIEATFFDASENGTVERQTWWIECKGRAGALEADEVHRCVNHAMARKDLDRLIIATNTTFTNPTRDWVKEWQVTHPKPAVSLWDGAELERCLMADPNVVLRLFSEALSPEARLDIAVQRFWSKLESPPEKALRSFWNNRHALNLNPSELLVLTVGEFANGDISQRPWAAAASSEDMMEMAAFAFDNLVRLHGLLGKLRVPPLPVWAALSHILVASLQIRTAEEVAKILLGSFDQFRMDDPDGAMGIVLTPIMHRLAGEMQDLCSSDCTRVISTETAVLSGVRDPVRKYWKSLSPDLGLEDPYQGYSLHKELDSEKCNVGFDLGVDRHCAVFGMEPTVRNVLPYLRIVERVSRFRLDQSRKKVVADTAHRRAHRM